MSLTAKASQYGDELLSIRGGVFLLGKICLIAAVGLAYETGLALHDAQREQLAASAPIDAESEESEQKKESMNSYRVITSRNVFGVKEKPSSPVAPSVPVTSLKLRLVGTNVTPDAKPFAIIENEKNKEQDLFELNDSVFSQAILIKVEPESVQVRYNGKLETLVLTEGAGSSPSAETGIAASEDGSEFVVAESEVNEALANLPRLLSQARAVPYFKNGESVGMRLFAIRRGSLYEKLGLKNGDILKSVNDNSLSDPTQALKIFEQLKSERSISVVVERGGNERSLQYEIR